MLLGVLLLLSLLIVVNQHCHETYPVQQALRVCHFTVLLCYCPPHSTLCLHATH